MSQWALLSPLSLEYCMGMEMHLADAGTYSCHSLPADSHDTILLLDVQCGMQCKDNTRKWKLRQYDLRRMTVKYRHGLDFL